MTVREMLSRSRSELKNVGRLRYKTGTTTSAGATDGSTIVSTGIGGVDDAWNRAEARITSGDNSGERREIGDFATSTLTLVENFSFQVANSVTFEIGEGGFISDHELIELFTEAQDKLITYLVDDAFPAHSKRLEVAGTAGVSAALPSDLAGPPKSLKFRDTSSVVRDVVILPVGEEDRLTSDAYLGSSLDDMAAIFQNGVIEYAPANNGTLLLPVVPRFDSVSFSGGSKLPSYLHPLQIEWATYKGWQKAERLDLAVAALSALVIELALANGKQRSGFFLFLLVPQSPSIEPSVPIRTHFCFNHFFNSLISF